MLLEMFVLSREKRTLDDFRGLKVPQLKEFLRNRGLNTTGTKNELACIGFRCGAAINRRRGNNTEKRQYKSLLNVNGEQLPDLFTHSKITGSVKRVFYRCTLMQ